MDGGRDEELGVAELGLCVAGADADPAGAATCRYDDADMSVAKAPWRAGARGREVGQGLCGVVCCRCHGGAG